MLLILSILITFIFYIINPNYLNYSNEFEIIDYELNLNGYVWPIPGYYALSSYFGKRNSPTSGASSNHSGIDIPAPEGTKLIAVCDGTIIFTGFLGAGGYTITLEKDNVRYSYCHVSPNYIVKKGDIIKQGQVIGYVGPKYVDVVGNIYYDSSGRGTNGATTRCHLHFGMRINSKYVNPLEYIAK